jgi:hypothetical protein
MADSAFCLGAYRVGGENTSREEQGATNPREGRASVTGDQRAGPPASPLGSAAVGDRT